ncbi:efflux RND transporter periplasmic adaptor subunit [Fusibacter paucivorans]|uniref:Efflux RND transporter periplasmic adaptor subunit n=1 Tax=Fusibacter paucivorans TaxID=76009 RepID=A0ABS5PKP6_9FIRM|nr:efflux RND transporter periplasmic adaptor subunit [Fusibacter paucivorans]MBS7525743.1 efflux RND transporter periplasmic adaptor subunit [Fusibacter paucivorans]
MKHKKLMIGIVGAAAIVAVVIGIHTKQHTVSEAVTVLSDPIAVTVTAPYRDDIEETVFTIGEVQPAATYSVMAKTAGTVETVYYDVGDFVTKNDILFKLDTSALSVTQQSTLDQVQNAVKQAKLALDQAQDQYDRQDILFGQGAVSKAAMDSAATALDNAVIQYENAQTSAKSTQKQLEEQYDAYVQKSPVSGTIVSKNIDAGQFVSSQVVYTIIPDESYIVSGSITSKYINDLAKGQPVSIYVKTLDKHYTGTVQSVSSVASRGSYPIEVAIEGDNDLKAGLYAELEIVLSAHEDVLLVPKRALIQESGNAYAYTVDNAGTVMRKTVETGITSGDAVEIEAGLSETDQIVLKGLDFIEPGDFVSIVTDSVQ